MLPSYRIRQFYYLLVLVIALLISGCARSSPIQVSSITIQPDNEIPIGEQATLSVEVSSSGDNLSFKWTAARGTIKGEGSSIIYTAPDTAGPDPVTAEVTNAGSTVMKNLTIQVIPPSKVTQGTVTTANTSTLEPLTSTAIPINTPGPSTSTSTPEPQPDPLTPDSTALAKPTDSSLSPTPTCPPADAEGTVSPVITLLSVTFEVNGAEQVVDDFGVLQAAVGDQVSVKDVTICIDPFEGNGGQIYVEFDPVDTNGEIIGFEVKGTRAIPATPGSRSITGKDYTWTIGDNWRHFSVNTIHYPTGGGTKNLYCENGACEVDDRMIISIE